MRRQHALLALAAVLMSTAALLPTLLLVAHSHPQPAASSESPRKDEVHIGLEPTINGSRTVLIQYAPATRGLEAHVLVEDPARMNNTVLAQTNTTHGDARLPLDSLPQLFRLRLLTSGTEPVHVRWCWSGKAHFVCATTPAELAPALRGSA